MGVTVENSYKNSVTVENSYKNSVTVENSYKNNLFYYSLIVSYSYDIKSGSLRVIVHHGLKLMKPPVVYIFRSVM